ncbi:uncharacterized protein SETTUDRAFT_18636 [Exserohilum turcica Et28A]|uniref:Uncharacterized protein n=1 Tax=Exserohilum turcicum (strain 28A) TaxID=671987 RepID=R0J5F5_EXST2|nr:uncharacterized protein SETTUDRAFT_18636 [Exserohilum turcica Et28A]EOA91976.1 hypothetical protein SETTUDRAFT_18636 [Exserohilum turcica Et28A]
MKYIFSILALATFALAGPIPQTSYQSYGDYKDVPPPAGGYGNYGSYKKQ